MEALDHKTARGHQPPIASRSSQGEFAGNWRTSFGLSAFESSSDDEYNQKKPPSRKGQSSAVAMAAAGIAHMLGKQSLESSFTVLEYRDPRTIRTMECMMGKWWVEGRFAEVEPLVRLFVVQKDMLGPRNRETMLALCILASAYHEQERIDRCAMMAPQIAKDQEEVLGQRHIDRANTLSVLEGALSMMGRLKEAVIMSPQV